MQWYVLLSRKSVLRGGKLLGEIMILENLRILYIIPPQLSLTNVNAAPAAVLKMRGGAVFSRIFAWFMGSTEDGDKKPRDQPPKGRSLGSRKWDVVQQPHMWITD